VAGLVGGLLVVLGVRSCLSEPLPPALPQVTTGDLVGFRLEVAFPALNFERPVYLCHEPGQPDQLWVLEQGGKVFRFSNDPAVPAAELALDLSAKVSRRGNEEGLLGLAFAPDHATSRVLYLYYSPVAGEGWVGGRSRLSRFRRAASGAGIDAASEEILLEVEQPYSNHNGGMLTFGPDGYLYLGLGDGGAAGDLDKNAQNKNTLLGSILRLDVSRAEGGKPYAIPADNPFQGDPQARPEIFAFGLRNPWRFSFDRQGGALFVGDVGQGAWEEVHEVSRGDNCGWRRYEGFSLYDEDMRAPAAREPVSAYARSEGVSITGGYVYRGQEHSKLAGCYLYGDYLTGNVWALIRDPSAPALQEGSHRTQAGFRVLKLIEGSPALASFGEDASGEVYTCHFDGKIRRFVQSAREGASESPGPAASARGGK